MSCKYKDEHGNCTLVQIVCPGEPNDNEECREIEDDYRAVINAVINRKWR